MPTSRSDRHQRIQTILLVVAVSAFSWQIYEQARFRMSLDVRRLRSTEPLVTTITHSHGSTQIYTPTIEGESVTSWVNRHTIAVMEVIRVFPLATEAERKPSHDDVGSALDERGR